MTFDITHLGKKNWLKEKCLFLEEKDLLNPFFPSCSSSSTEEPPKAPSCKPSVCSDSMHTLQQRPWVMEFCLTKYGPWIIFII